MFSVINNNILRFYFFICFKNRPSKRFLKWDLREALHCQTLAAIFTCLFTSAHMTSGTHHVTYDSFEKKIYYQYFFCPDMAEIYSAGDCFVGMKKCLMLSWIF